MIKANESVGFIQDRQDDRLHHKTLDGKKAGLQDSKTLKLENEAAKRRERKLFEKVPIFLWYV